MLSKVSTVWGQQGAGNETDNERNDNEQTRCLQMTGTLLSGPQGSGTTLLYDQVQSRGDWTG